MGELRPVAKQRLLTGWLPGQAACLSRPTGKVRQGLQGPLSAPHKYQTDRPLATLFSADPRQEFCRGRPAHPEPYEAAPASPLSLGLRTDDLRWQFGPLSTSFLRAHLESHTVYFMAGS